MRAVVSLSLLAANVVQLARIYLARTTLIASYRTPAEDGGIHRREKELSEPRSQSSQERSS